MYKGCIAFIFLFFTAQLKSQSITPITINVGGFYGEKDGYSLTVSTGESISVTNFVGGNNYNLSSGFLQIFNPLVTGIDDIQSRIAENEIKIAPNPTTGLLFVTTSFFIAGNVQFQIMNELSQLLYKSANISSYGYMQSKVDLTNYSTGKYYLQVIFKTSDGKQKEGIYKIIKL